MSDEYNQQNTPLEAQSSETMSGSLALHQKTLIM